MEMPNFGSETLDELIRAGAIRLEITNGIPTWEAFPGFRHQRIIDQIRATIVPTGSGGDTCACIHAAGVLFRFPDGSLKRPDIAIFCTEPPLQDEALTTIPAAVIEIISRGYEYKDVVINPPFYLSQGVADVVIHDPAAQRVAHYTRNAVTNHHTPITLTLSCGCTCAVP